MDQPNNNKPIIICNICKLKLAPEVRINHMKFHKLTWKQIVKFGIFSYNESEFKVNYSEDGYCTKCGALDIGVVHATHYDEELDADIELLECCKCEELFYAYSISSFGEGLWEGDLIKSRCKKNFKPKILDDDKTCGNCGYSVFRFGSTICVNVVKYNDDVVVTNIVGRTSSCKEFVMKTKEQKDEYIRSIRHFFGEGKGIVNNVP